MAMVLNGDNPEPPRPVMTPFICGRREFFGPCSSFLLLLSLASVPAAPAPNWPLEDFEDRSRPALWIFSAGGEFPGAKGSFEWSAEAARQGRQGGRLRFDFSDGGRYVAAQLNLSAADQTQAANWNALQLWVHHPEGNDLTFRYTDATGQTLQRGIECPGGRWAQATIPFSGWTGQIGRAHV
jgi:hypothetical protein